MRPRQKALIADQHESVRQVRPAAAVYGLRQCEGAIVQGLGFALTEETQIDNGVIKTNNFTTYIIPTISDVPEIEIDPVETYEKIGPFGAKGLGEIGIIPVGSAIANAIYDATGIRVFTLPATPERVDTGLKRGDGSQDER